MMNGARFKAIVCLLICGLCWGCSSKTADDVVGTNSGVESPQEEELGSLTFIFNFSEDRQVTVNVDGVAAGDTVLECLERVTEPEIVVQGSGQNAFVSRIGDKGTAADQGWSYRVNDDWADRSVGVYEISPGDVVTWSYGGFEAGD